MNIAVCVKITAGEISPFDGAALECALRLGGNVTVVSMCPPSAADVLTRLTRLGVRAVLLSDPVFAGSDTLATSYILSCALRRLSPDLILCGRQSVDGDTAQVGPALATTLGLPVITNVTDIPTLDGQALRCATHMCESGEEASLPCLLTFESVFLLRFPRLGSRPGTVEVWDNGVIRADPARCGLQGSPTRVMQVFENQAGRRKCRFLSMEELPALVERLRKEQQKAPLPPPTGKKLKEIWTVGPLPAAETLAERVTVIDSADPRQIAVLTRERSPEVILWNADLWGRRNAPITAALLGAGLCADCTALETDGERLYMYRPAGGGSITAKICCRTNPQMATVRTVTQSRDVVVAGGRGVKDSLDRLREFAASLNADLGASRGLVDLGLASYSQQVGLTGKTVSPAVYIAVGISGAVHHTCAIERAGAVVAINPDPSARIFDYADYGILAEF